MDPSWYIKFFNDYYLRYFADRKTSSDTKKEVAFIFKVLKLPRKARILDLACGTGRHSIELAKRGYEVFGIDFHEESVKIARASIKSLDKRIKFIKGDMRRLPFNNEFDAVINMFTSFGYFSKDKENDLTLREISKSLKKRGLLLLDLQNKYWQLNNISKKSWEREKEIFIFEKRQYDRKRKLFVNDINFIFPSGKSNNIKTMVRLFDLKEIKNKLLSAGMKITKVFGDYDASNYNTKRSPRMIVLARKVK